VIVDFYEIPIGISLGVVAGILTISILASLWKAKIEQRERELSLETKELHR
jgi:NhaP-type Na+/H+ or K+/H+ antiporter